MFVLKQNIQKYKIFTTSLKMFSLRLNSVHEGYKNMVNYVGYFCSLLITIRGGARGVMVTVVGNGHGDTSSNPGRDWLHFT